MTQATLPIIIVGAGAAGLSAGGALKRRGLDALILEQDPRVGEVWARRYDRLRLHTMSAFSGLAHFPIPRSLPRYLPKDVYAQYLRDYARRFDLKIVAGCRVHSVRPAPGAAVPLWQVESVCGTWLTRAVVIAMGQYGVPTLPRWPGAEQFAGRLAHSSEYRSGRDYAGQRVLVIGAGNSGSEIAVDLVEQGAAFVAISIRTPPPIVPRDPFGMPVQRSGMLLSRLPPRLADRLARAVARLSLGDLTRYGLPPPAWLPYAAQHPPVIDVGFVDALKRGLVHIRPGVARFTPGGVVYADGCEEAFEAVIAATGFTSGLERILDAPDALDEQGYPRAPSGTPTAYPGLYFVGYTRSLRGHLFEANRDSRRLAALLARQSPRAGSEDADGEQRLQKSLRGRDDAA